MSLKHRRRRKIEELVELNKLDKVERKKYYPIINWFESNEFYLTNSECELINNLRKELEQKEKNLLQHGLLEKILNQMMK
jgi:hypothetical protein